MDFQQSLMPMLIGILGTLITFFLYFFLRLTKDISLQREQLEILNRRRFESEKELSKERISLENQIADLSHKLTKTQKNFLDVNHLVVEAQEKLTPIKESNFIDPSKFLESLNAREEDKQIDENLVFVLMPFNPRETSTFAAIVKAFEGTKMKVLRGDEEPAKGDVLSHIIKQMLKARLVIANVNSRNPNVMYELGIAHALNKNVIIIADSENNMPFDINSRRILFYRSNSDLTNKIKSELIRNLLTDEGKKPSSI